MSEKTLDSTYHSVAEPAAYREVHDNSTRFNNVLVGVDGSASGRDAIALGAMLRNPHGSLTLAHVSPNRATFLSLDATSARAEAREMLERERCSSAIAHGRT